MVVAKGVRACRTRPRHGTRHTGHSRAPWGDADAGRPGLPSHAPCAGRRQAEQETAAWSLPMAGVGGGSVTHEARSGGGAGAGCLADLRRSHQGRGQPPAIASQVGARQGHERGQLFEQFYR
jgi:hypothetical protein